MATANNSKLIGGILNSPNPLDNDPFGMGIKPHMNDIQQLTRENTDIDRAYHLFLGKHYSYCQNQGIQTHFDFLKWILENQITLDDVINNEDKVTVIVGMKVL